jgi:putative ABC transport system permease protein
VRLLRLLALRHLRRRPLRAVLAVVAVAAGTALAVNVFVVRSSVTRSVEDFGRELAGPADLRVVGAVRRGGLEPSVADAVARTEGVARAVPMVQAVTVVERPDGADADADPEEESVLVLGVGDGQLTVGPGVDRRGSLGTRVGPVALAGRPRSPALAGVSDGNVVVLGLETAQRLFGRGDRLDVVYVDPDPGTGVTELKQRLSQAAGEQNAVLDSTQGPPEIGEALDQVLPLFTLLALFALGVGAMLVYNTAQLTLEERRRDLAVVGALGGTRAAVAGATLGEAAVTGAAGGVAGSAAAVLVAGPIVASLSAFTERSAGLPLAVHVTPGAVALGIALGAVLSVLAAVPPVRRALRADVAGELSGRGLRREVSRRTVARRAAAWAAVTAAGVGGVQLGNRDGGLERWQVPAGALGFAVAAIGLIMLGATLAPVLIGQLGRFGRAADRAPVRLAIASLVRDPRRTGVMAAAVMAALGTAFVTAGYSRGLRAAFAEDILDNVHGVQVSALAAGANANLDTGLAPDVLRRLEGLPGVREVQRGTTVSTGARQSDLVRVVAYQNPWLTDGDELVRGRVDLAAFEAGEALISRSLARDEGLRPGDTVRIPTPTRVVEIPVQAVYRGGTDRTVWLPWGLHRQLYGPQPARSVTLEAEPGTSPAELAREVRDAEQGTGVRVRTPAELVDEVADSADRQIAPFWALQRGLLAVSFVAVLSTLLLVGVQRRRELGLLGAVGMEPGELGRLVLAEAAAVTVASVVLSAGGGLVMLWAQVQAAPLLIGLDLPLRPDWTSLLTAGAVSLAVTLSASLWPARRAARTDLVVALQDE